MDIAIHWQDADLSSANAVTKHFLHAQIMICGGHAGRACRKILEKRQKINEFTPMLIERYQKAFPAVGKCPSACT